MKRIILFSLVLLFNVTLNGSELSNRAINWSKFPKDYDSEPIKTFIEAGGSFEQKDGEGLDALDWLLFGEGDLATEKGLSNFFKYLELDDRKNYAIFLVEGCGVNLTEEHREKIHTYTNNYYSKSIDSLDVVYKYFRILHGKRNFPATWSKNRLYGKKR